ncbi:hypothetical protein [Aquimonas sp.]|jgi:hypothetical protein|uniref:hypothetical protein n=1 Tax=Aquimonas sp. TaxID=1872588 RepID=UPI0037BFC91B
MGITGEFARLNAKLANVQWAVSARTADGMVRRSSPALQCRLSPPRPMTLAEAAECLAVALGTARPKWIEQRLANQGYDCFFRLRGAGFDMELRSEDWQVEAPQSGFLLRGVSSIDSALRPLSEQAGWRISPVADLIHQPVAE